MTTVKITSQELLDDEGEFSSVEYVHEVIDAPPIAKPLSSLHRVTGGVMSPVRADDRAQLLALIKKKDLAPRWCDELAAIRGEYASRLQAWRRVEKGIRQPSKRQPALAGEMTSLMEAAATFASRLEALSPEAVDLLTKERSPFEFDLFVLARDQSRSISTVSPIGLLCAARDAARHIEDQARRTSTVDMEALPSRPSIRQQILKKPEALERLSVVWFQQGRGGKGSEEFYEFADFVMRDIDPQFSSEYEWRKEPKGDQWVLRTFTLASIADKEV